MISHTDTNWLHCQIQDYQLPLMGSFWNPVTHTACYEMPWVLETFCSGETLGSKRMSTTTSQSFSFQGIGAADCLGCHRGGWELEPAAGPQPGQAACGAQHGQGAADCSPDSLCFCSLGGASHGLIGLSVQCSQARLQAHLVM